MAHLTGCGCRGVLDVKPFKNVYIDTSGSPAMAGMVEYGARALGAERRLLVKARRIEFGLLGATSGVLAALGSELISFVLYRYAFDLVWTPHPWLLCLPLIGALLVGGAGVFGTRRALNASPLQVLREG